MNFLATLFFRKCIAANLLNKGSTPRFPATKFECAIVLFHTIGTLRSSNAQLFIFNTIRIPKRAVLRKFT
jgi:hypothetical protein